MSNLGRQGRMVVLALALMVGGGTADGRGLEPAQALYDQGVMVKAAELARGFDTADGFALASQATLVAAVYQRAGHDHGLLRQAAEDARHALALDPDHVQAHLQLALALGYLAEDDPIEAHLNGTALEGKAQIDEALALAPEDAWAHGLLGVWHLRLVKYAGPLLAESLYGASLEQGREQCAEAASLAPDGVAIRYGCAVSLLEADPQRYRKQAMDTLDTVARLPADDVATRLIQAEARHRLDQLKSGDQDDWD